MKVFDLIRILYRNRALLILTPILLAVLVVLMTKNPTYTYTSETTLYTGIASGGGVKMDESVNYFATNTSFDNLINIIKSRETNQDVAIRLLTQHLMLTQADPKYISAVAFNELNAITPTYIRKLVITDEASPVNVLVPDSNMTENASTADTVVEKFSFGKLTDATETSIFPPSINKEAYEATVRNLKECMEASDSNFVYKLLNFNHPHYSLDAISAINVTRMESSDFVRLRFESDDPGICQQTLALFIESCIKNYKKIKENRSDAVVKYFEYELKKVSEKLKISENILLQFNEENNIINYYEQSKAVAIVKEDLEVNYNEMRIKLAGAEASIRRIEEKLKIQNKIIPTSKDIVQKRNQLSEINARIVAAETMNSDNNVSNKDLVKMHMESDKLKEDIRLSVSELYSYGNTTEGLPLQKLLNDWIDNVILYEDTKAGMTVQTERIKEFQKQYAIYAPAGANIKRIEREINVNENEYLEILHGLSLAKLKVQDAELSSSIKAVDTPYYPLTANPTKRKMLVVVAAFFGFLFILTVLLAMEYFDNSLKNPERASKRIKLANVGVFPKIFLKTKLQKFPFVLNRLLELTLQNIGVYQPSSVGADSVKTILIFSTSQCEGKTIVAGNIALTLKNQGKKVLFLNYDNALIQNPETDTQTENKTKKIKRYPLISRLLGYEDNRVDYNSPFLQSPSEYLEPEEYVEYSLNAFKKTTAGFKDLLSPANLARVSDPDFVIIEIPPILNYQYPVNLMASADATILVCRSNRIWTPADQHMMENYQKTIDKAPVYILNGVENPVLESILGELPKRRSKFRRLVKNLISLQFFNKNEI